MAIAAIVVSHDENVAASATVAAVDSQTLKPSLTIFAISLEAGLAKLPEALLAENIPADENVWVWLLSTSTQPLPNALLELQRAAELSPSAALVAPKLVSPANPRVIEQYGLTLTSSWFPFSQVSGAFDQSQHDDQSDALAVALEGSILRVSAIQASGGKNPKLGSIAGAFDLAMRLRLNGGRVLLAPAARVAVTAKAGFLISQASQFQLRKAQIQLATGFGNGFLVLLLALLAPVLAILASVWLTIIKRPERIGSTLAAGFWWFFTVFGKFARASKLSSNERSGIKNLKFLFARRSEVARARGAQIEAPAAQAERQLEVADSRVEFGASGGFWIMAALLAVSWQFWPKDLAVSGGGLLPLNPSLAQVFAHAGSSWQNLGLGLAAPSDPFSWVLFALGATTFWAPNLSITLLLFLVKPLAFAAAWRALSLITQRKGLLALGALVFAFLPALTRAQVEGRLGTVVALILMPWFIFTLARILEFGAVARRSVQAWTWVGLGSLLAAIISAGAPSLTPLVALAILLLAVYRFKRIGYLVWLPVPLLVLWIPLGVYLVVGQQQPLALITDPGPALLSPMLPMWQLLTGSNPGAPFNQFVGYGTAFFVLIAVFATLSKRPLGALGLWLALFASLFSAYALSTCLWFQASGSFPSPTTEAVNGSPFALLGLAGLLLAYLVVWSIDSAPRFWRSLAQTGSWLVLLLLGVQFVITPVSLKWSDGASMPALVVAQAAQDPQSRTLVLAPESGSTELAHSYSATIVNGAGIQADDLSVAYRYALAKLSNSAGYQDVAAAAANLISANGSSVSKQLGKLSIDFILVADQQESASVELASALDTVKELEPVGTTNFGQLWRVHSAHQVSAKAGSGWSVTKLVQVSVLALFALLAIPTRRRVRDSGNEDLPDLDPFEGEVVN